MIALKHGNEIVQNNMIASFSNVTQCSNQSAVNSEWKHFCLKMISMKKDVIYLDLTIKFSASTGKDYSESTGKCNSMVELFTSTVRAEIWIIQRSHLAPQRAKNTVNKQPNT